MKLPEPRSDDFFEYFLKNKMILSQLFTSSGPTIKRQRSFNF